MINGQSYEVFCYYLQYLQHQVGSICRPDVFAQYELGFIDFS